MTTTTLISKLGKMNIPYTIVDFNGYNMDIVFTINGKTFKAGFFKGDTLIQDYCRDISFDNTSQEIIRSIYKNFAAVLRAAER